MEFEETQIMDRYNQLPEKVKEVLNSPDGIQKIYDIGKQFHLHVDEQEIIVNEITYVLLGLIKSEKFIKNIQDKLNIDSDKAIEIAKEINNNIVLPLREYIQEIYGPSTETKKVLQKDTNSSILSMYTPVQIRKIDETKSEDNITEIVNNDGEIKEKEVDQQKIESIVKENMSSKKISIQETKKVELPVDQSEKTPPNNTPKKIDPYREPI